MTSSLDLLADIISIRALSQEHQAVLQQLEPSEIAKLVRHLYPEFKNNPLGADCLMRFAEKIKSSALSVSDWSSQIIVVYEWLVAHKRCARFDDVVEYIGCALEGSSLQMGHDIQWYLEHYGFAKSQGVPVG